ncbi:type VI secretion system baseplate subunit TssK [soil metagenome]
MTILQKPVWVEGLLLGQQHFQQWQTHIEQYQWLQLSIATTYHWGLQQLIIDEAALLNGQFRIKKCIAIFPNGSVVHYKEDSSTVLSCKLSNKMEKKAVYLGLPNNKNVTGITGYNNNHKHAAWTADYQIVADLYDADRTREVIFAKQNLQLSCDEELHEQYNTLKIAEVISSDDCQYHLVKEFIPALTCLKASEAMIDYLRRIIELIRAKVNTIQVRRQQFQGEATQFGHSDLTHFLLLLILNSTLPCLQYLSKNQTLPPQQLYLELAKLAGSLCSFSYEPNTSIPSYQHEDLSNTFSRLEIILRSLLDAVLPTQMTPLRLMREQDTLYSVDNIDSLLFDKVAFFLAVNYMTNTSDWINQFVRQVKLGSRTSIHLLVNSALTGVKITHTHRPPNKLPVKAGYEYFYIEPTGDCWQQIRSERTMAIFLPYLFIDAQIELVTVQE